MCGVYPLKDVLGPGVEISSTYEGRHITMRDDELYHPTHDPVTGHVAKGDPVVIKEATSMAVGVALTTGIADADLIAVDTEGIWALDVDAEDDGGAGSAVVPGDPLFINRTTCVISKITNVATQIPFGYALGDLAANDTQSIAVKVHFDPNYNVDLQIFKTIDVADPGAAGAAMKLTVTSDIEQTGGRLCALSVTLDPLANVAVQEVRGAEVDVSLATDIAVTGMAVGFSVNLDGGLSFASDVYGAWIHLRTNAKAVGQSAVMRLQANVDVVDRCDSFIHHDGAAVKTWSFGPLASCDAWELADGISGDPTGHLNVLVSGVAREIPLYTP